MLPILQLRPGTPAMLRINQQSNAAAAKGYYSSPAESGYYGPGEQELCGEWGGKAAERLGLSGEIHQLHFERLCDNKHPFTGERLTARTKANRRVGYDFNFHACKSASILYGVTDDPGILAAFRAAVGDVMQAMERHVEVRVRKRGAYGQRAVGNAAWLEAVHFTSRPVKGVIDPHLHGHCFMPNCCWNDVEHAWKAIDVAAIKARAPHWQKLFHRNFGERLAGLGYPVIWKGDAFEIDGIGRETIERFSGRTRQVELTAARRGVTDPREKDKLGALTRERKQKDVPLYQLREQWVRRLTEEERGAIDRASAYRRRASADPSHLYNQVMRRQRSAAYQQQAQHVPPLPRRDHAR